MGLLEDEWSQERFGRFFRENARLYKALLPHTDDIPVYRKYVAYISAMSVLFAAFRSKFMSLLFSLSVIVKQAVYASPIVIFYTVTYSEDYTLDAIA